MDCSKCKRSLFTADQLFFYHQSEKQIHLSLKPELRATIENCSLIIVADKPKSIVANCKFCGFKLGKVLPFGPSGTSFIAFGTEKVQLCGRQLGGKDQWRDHLRLYTVEQRDNESFFGAPKVAPQAPVRTETTVASIRFASRTNLNDFNWSLPHSSKYPREYQITAYVEALLRDLIVVIPTGAGKTLIAAMLLAKMRELNPRLLGVFVVDRVPLVFQQADAIALDTPLRVCRLCGENRSPATLRGLKDGSFDALVATAGVLKEALKRKDLSVSHFSCIVFDECHHASGSHPYTELLQMIQEIPSSSRPRILGLSASPFPALTPYKAQESLRTFLETYRPAVVFRPEAPRLVQRPDKWEIIDNSSEIDSYINIAIRLFNELTQQVPSLGGNPVILSLFNSNIVKGQLRAVRSGVMYLSQTEQKLIDDLILVLISVEVAPQMGVKEAVSILTSATYGRIRDLVDAFRNYADAAPKLKRLDAYLSRCDTNSRVLVFVSTREMARRLFRFARDKFPHLNPARVVGHGGHDGMQWEEEQVGCLADFDKGHCNLIICTSVLEEGLDVPECDLVIRYSSGVSLIKYIQTRGRARRSESQFVAFLDSREQSRIQQMEVEERIMDDVLRSHAREVGLPSKQAADIIDGLLKSKPELKQKGGKKRAGAVQDKCAPKLVVADLETIDADFQSRIVEELEKSQLLKVQKVLVLETSELSGTIFSPATTISVMVSARSYTKGFPADISYQQLCETWNFGLRGYPEAKVWSQLDKLPRASDHYQVHWTISGLSFGSFCDRRTFEESATLKDDALRIQLQFVNNKSFELHFVGRGYTRKMIIPFTSIFEFALIDWTVVTLFLPIISVPSLLTVGDSPEYINLKYRSHLEPIDRDLLKKFAENDVVALRFEFAAADETEYRSQWPLLRKVLGTQHYFPIQLYDTHVSLREPDITLYPIQKSLHDSARKNRQIWNLLWDISVMKSRRTVALPDSMLGKIYSLISHCDNLSGQMSILKYIEQSTLHSYWLDLKKVLADSAEEDLFISAEPPRNPLEVQRVITTPTRNVCYPPITMKSSRLFRKFGDFEFAIVGFRDEQLQKLRGVSSFEFVGGILRDGLLLNGRRFRFFCASASQLRDHKAFFIAADLPSVVLELRARIILNQRSFSSVAQYSSRLGLFCTSDSPSLDVLRESMVLLPDVAAVNGDKLTDGVGLIRSSVAEKVAANLKLDHVPSAFQIRIAGIKGVLLAVHDDHLTNLAGQRCSIAYRKSMLKFENDDHTLGIVSTSQFNPVKLNREIITLLEAIHPDVAPVLQELLDESLYKAVQMMARTEEAVAGLKEILPRRWPIRQILRSGFNLIEEPFWHRILKGGFEFVVEDLRKRTRIPVSLGGLVLGVADPFGELRDGEIFLQVQKNGEEPFTVNGPVIIYRNPCLYPGDVRRVTAVDKESLRTYKNVVLMPARSDCRYSLSAACSGGDLDGDLFSVIWDQRLIPKLSSIKPPLDYASLAKGMPENEDVTAPEAIPEFFVKCMVNDTLGRVAHVHLALCDQLEKGATDPLAMKMAESQSVAVDFPKTGIAPVVPKKALELVGDKGYPDFMEKKESVSYYSRKVIGELYRRTCSFAAEITFPARFDLDPDLTCRGYQAYLPSAHKDYGLYCKAVQKIMFQFGLQDEFEVILGRAVTWDPLLQADAGKATLMIQDAYYALKKEFIARFKDMAQKDEASEKAKAYAWYHVAYNAPESGTTPRLLSFPWLLADILCSIKGSSANSSPSMETSAYRDIGRGARAYFLENSGCLNQLISQRTSAVRQISSAIQRARTQGLTIQPYGSVSIFLCDYASDVDLAIVPGAASSVANCTPIIQARHYLQTLVSPAIDQDVEMKREILNGAHPHIKCHVRDGDSLISVDLSMNKVGVAKTRIIHTLYTHYPALLPCLWFIVRWSRLVGIVKDNRMPNSLAHVPTGDFYGLVLNLIGQEMNENAPIRVQCSLVEFFDSLVDKVGNLVENDDIHLGQMLVRFFEKASAMKGPQTVRWHDDDIPDIVLKDDVVREVSQLCTNALYSLLASRNAEFLIRSFYSRSDERLTVSLKLPMSLSRTISDSLPFHASRLASLTNAEVELKIQVGDTSAWIRAEGSRPEIFRLYEEIQNMVFTSRAACVGVVRTKAARYFMMGSELLLVAGSNSSSAQVEFPRSRGPFQIRHALLDRSVIKLCSVKYLGDWRLVALEKFVANVFRQISQFPVTNAALLKTLDITTRFGGFYLIHVSSCLPETRRTLSIDELSAVIQKSRTGRKNFMRSEFGGEKEEDGEASDELTTLKPSEHNPLTQPATQSIACKKKKKGLGSNFCVGLNMESKAEPTTLSKVVRVYAEALAKSGFRPVQKEPSYVYQCCIALSRAYEARVYMNQGMEVIGCKERDLHWADTYILHGEESAGQGDVMEKIDCRIGLVSAEPVQPGSTIHKMLFPSGSLTPPIRLEEGNIRIAEHMKRSGREKIHYVHHKQSSARFELSSPDFNLCVGGTVSLGVVHEGKDLKLEMPFYKLTLHFDMEPFKKALRESCRTQLRKLCQDIFFVSLKVKEGLEAAAQSRV